MNAFQIGKRIGAAARRVASLCALWVAAMPALAQPAGGQLAILFGGNGFGDRAVAEVIYRAERNRPPDQVIAGIEGQWNLRDPTGGIPIVGAIELVENLDGACTLLNGNTTLRLAISNGATPLESRILCRIRYGGPWPDPGFGIRLVAQTPFTTISPLGLPTTGPALSVLNGGRTDGVVPAGSVSPGVQYTVPPDPDQRIDAQPEIVFPSPPAPGEASTYRFHIIQTTIGNGSFGTTFFSSCWLDNAVGTGGAIQLAGSFGFYVFNQDTSNEPPRPVDLRCIGTEFETRGTLICQEARLIQGLTRWWDIRCPAAGTGEPGNQPGEPPLFRDGFEPPP